MTEGERAIWAAAFALHVNESISSPPSHVIHDAKKWADWEDAIIARACERAAGFVVRAREILPSVVEGFGLDGPSAETTRQLHDMLGVEMPAPQKDPSGDAGL